MNGARQTFQCLTQIPVVNSRKLLLEDLCPFRRQIWRQAQWLTLLAAMKGGLHQAQPRDQGIAEVGVDTLGEQIPAMLKIESHGWMDTQVQRRVQAFVPLRKGQLDGLS